MKEEKLKEYMEKMNFSQEQIALTNEKEKIQLIKNQLNNGKS